MAIDKLVKTDDHDRDLYTITLYCTDCKCSLIGSGFSLHNLSMLCEEFKRGHCLCSGDEIDLITGDVVN